MKVIKILILGYSSFVRRRVAPTLKKNKNVNFCICSLSSEIDQRRNILFNNYKEGLKKFQPDLVYISKVNSLHYRLAKKILNLGFNVIVDKPITLKLKQTRELIKIAKTKKLLLAESVVFNYHKVFETIKKQYKNIDNIEHVQSVFNIPFKKTFKLKEISD